MEEFVACFAEVVDPRQDNARHNLHELLLIALCTILTGGKDLGSSGRRNTLREEVAMAMAIRKRRSDRSGRGALPSPGRPSVARREDHRQFWAAIAAGCSSEDAAVGAGVSPAVGARWFRR